jgi:uncharacterized YccA/Bax inhibitor family protein
MANPALNDQALQRQFDTEQLRPGWGSPSAGFRTDRTGPMAPTAYDQMTVAGSVTATGVLLVLLTAAGVVGWNAVKVVGTTVDFPGWVMLPLLAGLGLAIGPILRPQWARITAPLYALAEGVAVGAISKLYNIQYDGIVINAVGGTVAVLAVMLFLHATRIIKVTDRFRMIVFSATGAIFLVFMVNLVLSLFGAQVPLLNDASPLGILVSVAIIVVAALNLSLDFDFIERGVKVGAPKRTEWYAAFGLLVTLVWLYLEMLRLLAKLQRR